jgi:hypothetical protein
MKNALILHGTYGTPNKNWFQWLKKELEQLDYKVWVPQLPKPEKPNLERYNKFLLSKDFEFNKDTIIIGHSSGAVAILGLLEGLPKGIKINSAYLIAGFIDTLGWDELNELFLKPFNYKLIKTKAKKFTYFHSDNDPYIPLEQAKYLVSKTDGELVLLPGEKHFSIDAGGSKYKKFPELLAKIKQTA